MKILEGDLAGRQVRLFDGTPSIPGTAVGNVDVDDLSLSIFPIETIRPQILDDQPPLHIVPDDSIGESIRLWRQGRAEITQA
mgnify:CR=1 FL=1